MLKQLKTFLDICEENHIIISPKKIQYAYAGKFEIFPGMKLSEIGCSQDPDKMHAMRDYLRQENKNSYNVIYECAHSFNFGFLI